MPLVLLIEDDASFRDILSGALTDEGYEVIAAPNGAAALALLEHHQPDVILLDIYLPILDGRRFVRLYRERPGPRAPILIMTAMGHAAERAAALSAAGGLDKPFDLSKLFAKVEEILGRSTG